MYIEETIKEINESYKNRIIIQEKRIKWLRFADDIVLLAKNRKDFENVLNNMDRQLRNAFGLKINKSKMKVIKSYKNEKSLEH